MPNFLKDNNYNWSSIQCVAIANIAKHPKLLDFNYLKAKEDELNLLTIVLKKHESKYICIDNIELLQLRILQNVKVVHAVVLE